MSKYRKEKQTLVIGATPRAAGFSPSGERS